jgi:hypothetical protein
LVQLGNADGHFVKMCLHFQCKLLNIYQKEKLFIYRSCRKNQSHILYPLNVLCKYYGFKWNWWSISVFPDMSFLLYEVVLSSWRSVFVFVVMSHCDMYCGICALPLDVKWLEYGADHSSPSNVRVTMCEILFLCPLSAFMTCCLGTEMFYHSLPVDLWCAAVPSSSSNKFCYRYVFGLCSIEEFFNDRTFKECVYVHACVCMCMSAHMCPCPCPCVCVCVCVCGIYIKWCRCNVR